MSRHRVKALDYDEDALEDEYDEVDPEEQEQLEAYTNEVLSELRGGQPPVTSSREEVQEALWHYYNDVSKSVNYLRGGRTICQMWSITINSLDSQESEGFQEKGRGPSVKTADSRG
jgi:hypothetical protein